MSEGEGIVLETLTTLARENGFKPVGKVYFYKEHPEVTCVLNMQRSAWGPQHYINAGVSFLRLSDNRRPKENKLHIRWRACSLETGTHPTALAKALDLEVQMPDEERRRTIRDDVQQYAFSHLARCTNEATAIEVGKQVGAMLGVVFEQ